MTSDTLTRKQVILERLTRNGILRNFQSARGCAASLCGIQFQLRNWGEVSLYLRVRGLKRQTLEMQYSDHELIDLWGHRKTLHVHCSDDRCMICDIYHSRNYLDKILKGREDVFDTIREKMEDFPPDSEIGRDVIDGLAGMVFPDGLEGDMPPSYAMCCWLTNNGYAFQVPDSKALVRTSGPWGPVPENTEASIKELMRRYFTYFGPASRKDFCQLSGLPMSSTEHAFRELEDSLDIRVFGGREVYSIGDVVIDSSRPFAILGKYDPLLLSFADKSWIADDDRTSDIWRKAGRVEAVIVDCNGAVGTWNASFGGKKADFDVEPFCTFSDAQKKKVSKRFTGLSAFLGKVPGKIVFNV